MKCLTQDIKMSRADSFLPSRPPVADMKAFAQFAQTKSDVIDVSCMLMWSVRMWNHAQIYCN